MDRAFEGTISEVVVADQDRFCRFGFVFVIKVFEDFGVKIVVYCQDENPEDASRELQEDLISIFTLFVAKNNGKRAAENRRRKRRRR